MIVRRFEAATGNQAVLVETGETFEALATQGWNRRWAKAGSSSRRRAAEEPEAATGQARGCLHCGDQRFESPQLHQEVGANRPGFPAPTIPRLFSALARKLLVCAVYSAGTAGLGRANAEMSSPTPNFGFPAAAGLISRNQRSLRVSGRPHCPEFWIPDCTTGLIANRSDLQSGGDGRP